MRRVLTVGVTYTGDAIDGVEIDNLGLCRPDVNRERSAYPLYEYDTIIINPASYTHFLFGEAGEFSNELYELGKLKSLKDSYDIDSAFDGEDRRKEMEAAIADGATVVWCLSEPKRVNFFGYRETHLGYAVPKVASFVKRSELLVKKGRRMGSIDLDSPFARYFEVPLDLAADLPPIAFGTAKLGRLTADELRTLVDENRLKRLYPQQDFDAERFSEFHWLTVEETVALEQEPEARAVPVLFMDLSQDLGQIEPHKGRFPSAVEDALFFLLLAPWESWSTMTEVDWRGFRVPWVYTVDSDIFVRPSTPPSPDTLSWEPRIYDDGYGGTIEEERPVELRLEDDVATELPVWDQSRWTIVEQAKQSVLFETPIPHFLVRAFLAEGVDEFLAHITTIEAALGLRADYQKSFRVAPDRHKGMRATNRMRGRVAGLLGSRSYADQYERLFDVRSAFLHGRAMAAISTEERVMARSLARKVVEALILATQAGPISSREDFLDGLLDKGAPLL